MLIERGPPDVRVNLFGGRGEVRVYGLLHDAAEPFTAVLWCELAPGGTVGPHIQEEFPEVVVGIDGDGEGSVDGQVQPLRAGSAIHLPLGSVLSIVNRSDAISLKYLIIKARATPT